MQLAGAAGSEILFGGPGESGVRDLPQPEAAGAPLPWWRVSEAAFYTLTRDPEMRALFGDPDRGASLVQAWRTAQLSGLPPKTCLIDSAQPRITREGISTAVLVPRDEMARLVCRALQHRARSSVQLFVFDGTAGHSVVAHSADPDGSGVTFHDPWPGDSLLSAGHNRAGVAAQRQGTRWHITTTELQKVLVAAFVSPAVWASLCGRPGLQTLSELRGTELWSFFNLHEVGRDDSDPTYVQITLEPGGFTEHVGMTLTCYETEEICGAELRLRQSWVIGPPMGINPFAKDIAKGWLAEIVPQADRENVLPLVQALWGADMTEEFKARTEDPAWRESDAGRLVAAYLGLVEQDWGTAFAQTSLQVGTVADEDGTKWTRIRIIMW